MKIIKKTTRVDEQLDKKIRKKLIDSNYGSFQDLNIALLKNWIEEK